MTFIDPKSERGQEMIAETATLEPTTQGDPPPALAVIELPDFTPMSALDGYRLVALDTGDASANLLMMQANVGIPEPGRPADAPAAVIVQAIPVVFHATQPGFIVLTYDALHDPRSPYRRLKASTP